MNDQLVNININFDSLFFPLTIDRKTIADPSFFSTADRFFSFANKYDFKYTIFIIGKDLENPEVSARIRSWSEGGHEIGNHSLTHNPNLGNLPRPEMEYEVVKSHEVIAKCIGHEPRGFISPSWSTSADLVDILIKNNYLYDTSIFPSYFQYLVLFKLALMTKKHSNFHVSFRQRRDKWAFLFAPRKPYFIKPDSLIKKQKEGLLVIPLPVVTPFRIPCWHTMYFVFGRRITNFIISRAMKDHKYFYYLLHPCDLLDYESDLSNEFKEKYKDELTAFERLCIPFPQKMDYAEDAFGLIGNGRRRFVTLEEMARAIHEEKNKNNGGLRDKAGSY